MPPRASRSRRWCFTSYLEKAHFEALTGIADGKFTWFVAGAEICPRTQRAHVQGACILGQAVTMATLKLLLQDPAVHLEGMKGSPMQSDVYCKKEDAEAFEYGDMPAQGKRTDILLLKDALEAGATDVELWADHFPVMIKSDQAVKRYRMAMTAPRDSNNVPTIVIHTGPSGCGKTRAMPKASDSVYWHALGKWWDGYCGQSTVVFDEFYGQMPYQNMLRILDRHPMLVETKGGTCQLTATTFYFTSNKPWQSWWEEAQQRQPHPLNTDAFVRRVQEWGTVVTYDEAA